MSWTQRDELVFLSRLGTYMPAGQRRGLLSESICHGGDAWRLRCLRSYLRALDECGTRRWDGKVDVELLRRRAQSHIQDLENEIAAKKAAGDARVKRGKKAA